MSIMSMLVAGGGGVFTPLSLFASGEQGAWYDPSDLTTMFEDSAGTTPVHTPGNGVADSPVGKILDKSGRGNHATQSTGTARPTLSAKYNLLTYTQQFTNAVWSKSGTVVDNATTDPLGGSTAASLTPTGTSNNLYCNANPYGTKNTFSVAMKKNVARYGYAYATTGSARYGVAIDLNNGTFAQSYTAGSPTNTSYSISDLGNGWYRLSISGDGLGSYCVIECSSSVPTVDANLNVTNSTSGEGIYVWGADLRILNDFVYLPSYQRVVDAYTYDVTGFPYHLKFDGSDDTYTLTSIDRTSWTDAMCVTSAMTLATGSQGAVIDGLDNASFANAEPYTDLNWYVAFGSSVRPAVGTLAYFKPFVLTRSRSSGTSYFNINTVQSATTAAGTTSYNGTGNINLGKNDSTGYYPGRIFGIVLRAATSTATQISNTENWLNSKYKAY